MNTKIEMNDQNSQNLSKRERKGFFLGLLLFAFLCLSAIAFPLRAQHNSTQGKDFYVAFGQNAAEPASKVNLQIRIVASKTSIITGTYTANPAKNFTVTIPAGSVYTRALDSAEVAAVYCDTAGIFNKSLHIESDVSVSVFALNQLKHTADATNVLPVSNWGREYYHLSYPAMLGRGDGLLIIADSNGTIVYDNAVQVATLNVGEVYAVYFHNGDATGKHITTSKNAAYIAVNSCVNVPVGTGACDCLFQQLPPTNLWGNNFLIPVTRRGKERVRVLASQNSTNITQVGGTVLAYPGTGNLTINAGQYVELEITLASGGCYVSSDKPVAITSYLIGMADSTLATTLGDPAMAWIPPMEQLMSNALVAPFVPNTATALSEHWVLIITPTASRDSTMVAIGGSPPSPPIGGSWTTGAGSLYSFYSLPLSSANSSYLITNPYGLTVMGYGLGDHESYYYLAAAAARNLMLFFKVNDIHYEDIDGDTLCANPFKLEMFARMPISANSGRIKWFIDGVEDTSARDKTIIPQKWMTSGERKITLEVLDTFNLLHEMETTIFINCLQLVAPDTVQTYESTPKEIQILDYALLSQVCPSAMSIFANPKHGTATIVNDSCILYKPANGFIGWDSLTFKVVCNDDSITAKIYIEVLEKMSVVVALPSLCQNAVDTIFVSFFNSMYETAYNISLTEIAPWTHVTVLGHLASAGTYSGSVWRLDSLKAKESARLRIIIKGTTPAPLAPYQIYVSSENGISYHSYNSSPFKTSGFLNVNASPRTVLKRAICDGDSVFFASKYLTTAGIYHDTLPLAKDCDSIVTLHLVVGGKYTISPHIIDDPCSDEKSSVSLTFLNGLAPYTCLWNTGESGANLINLDPGTYRAVVADSVGCTTDYEVTFVRDKLIVSYTTMDAHCNQADGSFTLTIVSDSTNINIDWGTIEYHSDYQAYNLLPGLYPVTVSDGLCSRNLQIRINNIRLPVACFTVNYQQDNVNAPVIFNNCSQGGISHLWDFGDGSFSSDFSPKHRYADTGLYTVLLSVAGDFNCIDTISRQIHLFDPATCYLPTAFTPNGDGLNDVFIPVCHNIQSNGYTFTIHDRWGNKIFETHDSTQPWDGTINGEPVPQDVFVWTVSYQDRWNVQTIQRGHITLIR